MSEFEDSLKKWLDSKQSANPMDQGGLVGAGIGAAGALINGNQLSSSLGDNAASYRQQADQLGQQMSQMPTLESMYGQASPYAAQMRETLARKDAAAGRNSQYGPREAQFQALLADKGSQYAAQQAQSMAAYNQARNSAMSAATTAQGQQAQIRAQQLASLFNVANKTGATDWMNKGLGGLFGGGNPNQLQVPSVEAPNYSMSGPGQGSYGLNTNYTQPDNQFSLQTGNAPGMTAGSNALMPSFSNNTPAPSGGFPQDTGTDYWLDNQ